MKTSSEKVATAASIQESWILMMKNLISRLMEFRNHSTNDSHSDYTRAARG